MIRRVRSERPLVHNIINIVAANPAANILLSAGALPVMSHDAREVEDVVMKCQALVLNTGTLVPDRLESMLLAGRAANREGIPVVLDPVGAGASRARGRGVLRLLEELDIAIIRGNVSEIAFLNGVKGEILGVEAAKDFSDAERVSIAEQAARRFSATVCMTGARDFVSSGEKVYVLENGHPLMARVTGTGCMLSALVGAFAAVTPDYLDAAVGAVTCYGIAGEMAAGASRGPGTFQPALYDALYLLKPEDIIERGKVRVVQRKKGG